MKTKNSTTIIFACTFEHVQAANIWEKNMKICRDNKSMQPGKTLETIVFALICPKSMKWMNHAYVYDI